MPLGVLLGRAADALVRRPAWWPLIVLFWAGIALSSYAWHLHELKTYAHNAALQRGRLIFQMVETMRDWAAQQSHESGFTDNSALMTRQIGELLQRERDPELRIRLTSLKLLNPANAPDAWEAAALQGFERGSSEHYGVDGSIYRYIAPLPTKESCLVCHAHQGHQVGDVRGGLTVSFPARTIDAMVDAQRHGIQAIHAVFFMLLTVMSLGSLIALRRRLLEIEAARGNLAEAEKMASLGRMVAGFAHEVNTPVGVAVGAVSQSQELVIELGRLLEKEEVTEEELRERLSMLDEASQLALANLRRAASMVQSFKRTAVDQTSDTARKFDLAEVLDDVVRTLHNQFKNTPVQIEVICPAGLTLFGQVGALEQVLTNLMVNSRIHAFDNGTHAGLIRIEAAVEEGHCHIGFRDDGAGMSPEVLGHIFEPFFTTRRGDGGSGLGMYIVYNLVTQVLGGRIRCRSTPGQGTLFDIEIPVSRPAQGENSS